MARDRRRGRRTHSPGAARTSPVSQKPAQPGAASKPMAAEGVAPAAKAPPPAKQLVLPNPRLAKDLRKIGIVTVVLVVLLIVLWRVL